MPYRLLKFACSSECHEGCIRHLAREALAGLALEAAAMANIPLAGTDWYPGI